MKRFAWIGLLLAPTIGCGPGNPLGRLGVSGKVTLDGAPLDRGTITFGTQTPGGVSSGAVIKDGAYSIPTEKGLPPGKYSVRINSATLPPAQSGDGGPAEAPGPALKPAPGSATVVPGTERVGAAYNVESKLVIEVVAGQPATFNFDVKSK